MEDGSRREENRGYCKQRLWQAEYFKKSDDDREVAQGVMMTGNSKHTVSEM